MLSIKQNFLFVHIPKTGGNSIQSILAVYSDDCLVKANIKQDGRNMFALKNNTYPTRKHSTIEDYRNIYPVDVYNNLFKFTTIRNTYERLISFYFSPHRGVVSWEEDSFIDFITTIKPISHFLSYPGQAIEEGVANMDFLLRYENLSSDFEILCDKLKIAHTPIPHLNKSSRGSWETYYNQRVYKSVYRLFHEEIDFFRFDKPR